MRLSELDNPDEIFWLFASVCLEGKLNVCAISPDEYKRVMSDYMDKRKIPSRDWMQNMFSDAMRRIGEYAGADNIWTREIMQGYWGPDGGHNVALLRENNSDPVKVSDLHVRFCSTYTAEITGVAGDKYGVRLEGDRKHRLIDKMYVLDGKVGDRIIIHRGKAIVHYG